MSDIFNETENMDLAAEFNAVADVPLEQTEDTQQAEASQEQSAEQKKKGPSEYLVEARNFIKNNGQGPLREKSVQAYVMSKVSAELSLGTKADPIKSFEEDPFFKMDLSQTEAKAFADDLHKVKDEAVAAVITARQQFEKDPRLLDEKNWRAKRSVISAAAFKAIAKIPTAQQKKKQEENIQKFTAKSKHCSEVGFVLMNCSKENRDFNSRIRDIDGAMYQPKYHNWKVPLDGLKAAPSDVRGLISRSCINVYTFKQDGGLERLMSYAAAQLVGRDAKSLEEVHQQSIEMKHKAAANRDVQAVQQDQGRQQHSGARR